MRHNQWQRPYPLLFLLIIFTLLVLTACTSTTIAKAEVIDTATVFVGDLTASATASGQVQARRQASLSVTTPGRVQDIYVRIGDTVAAGDPLLQLDTADLSLALDNAAQTVRLQEANLARLQEPAAAADLTAAIAAVDSAQTNLDDLLAGPTALDLAVYEATLRVSEASLWAAAAELNGTNNSVTDSQIQAAQANLLAAQMNLDQAQEANQENPTQETDQAWKEATQAVASAQARLDDLLTGPDTAVASSSVAAAAARRDGSAADLTAQQTGATATDIAAAESQLAQAQASLAELQAGPTAEDLAMAQAQLEQARLSLADAQQALAEATLLAPFAGVITAVNINPGEFATGIVVELIDPTSLEVILNVDEADIGQLSVGQSAQITLESWPETTISGELETIAAAAVSTASDLVTYEVHLSLGDTALPVRVGMTADAQLLTMQHTRVLLVPNQAIQADRMTGTYTVNRLAADGVTAVSTTVTIGLRDGQYTEITSGLQEGDQVLLQTAVPAAERAISPGNGPFRNEN